MTETAALLVYDVLPRQPVRQWVLSLPFALRYLLATRPEVVTQVLGIVYRAISGHLIRKAGLTRASAVTGAVTLIQRFGSALNLNVHFHLLVLDGVYRREGEGFLRFVPVGTPTPVELPGLAAASLRLPRVQRIARDGSLAPAVPTPKHTAAHTQYLPHTTTLRYSGAHRLPGSNARCAGRATRQVTRRLQRAGRAQHRGDGLLLGIKGVMP
jgi:hypothetical protein